MEKYVNIHICLYVRRLKNLTLIEYMEIKGKTKDYLPNELVYMFGRTGEIEIKQIY